MKPATRSNVDVSAGGKREEKNASQAQRWEKWRLTHRHFHFVHSFCETHFREYIWKIQESIFDPESVKQVARLSSCANTLRPTRRPTTVAVADFNVETLSDTWPTTPHPLFFVFSFLFFLDHTEEIQAIDGAFDVEEAATSVTTSNVKRVSPRVAYFRAEVVKGVLYMQTKKWRSFLIATGTSVSLISEWTARTLGSFELCKPSQNILAY